MVPLLSLETGGNAAAVMMSALTLKGVQLGPPLLTNQPTYLSATFMSMIVTNILMVVVAMAIASCVRAFGHSVFLSRPDHRRMRFALIGTYGDQMSATSVQIMVLAGIPGLVVRACHLNSAAIVLGLVLGSMCEQNFSRGARCARERLPDVQPDAAPGIAFVLIIASCRWSARSYEHEEKKAA